MRDVYIKQVVSSKFVQALDDEARSVVRRAIRVMKSQGFDVKKAGKIEISKPWAELQRKKQASDPERIVWYVEVRQFVTLTPKERKTDA